MNPLTIFHISDLHFGPPYVERVGEAAMKSAHELQPDIVIASGDFTQRAKPEQFAAARAYLDRLPKVPLVVTPGNHDVALYRIAERLLHPHDHYREHIHAELDYVVQHDRAFIVSLNSTAPRTAIKNGRIRQEQLDYAARAFNGAPDGAVRILVAHHHFAPAPDYERAEVMPKAKRALDCFKRLGVEMVFGGHLHRAYIGNSLDVYPGEDRDHGIIIIQSGTTTSRRGRARETEKNSFNLVRIDEEVVRITHHMYFDDQDGFAPISRHIFPRRGKRFFGHGHGQD